MSGSLRVAFALGLTLLASRSAIAVSVHGAELPEGAVKIGDDRYRAKDDWEKTLRFYRNVYGKTPRILWRTIASTPKVRAIHIANTRKGQTWEGINIYETNGEVFVYVLATTPEAPR